jgi:hypothetical protein
MPYPVNFQYEKFEGVRFDGMADTAHEARKILTERMTAARGRLTVAPVPVLKESEVGPYGQAREDIQVWWRNEIAAGFCTPIRVWGGWIAKMEYWAVD